MKLLLDTCVWGGAKAELQANGHDVIWTGDLAVDPGDEEILAQAHREGRVLFTLDKDFGELAIVHGKPHCGIVRLVNIRAKQQAKMCELVLAKQRGMLLSDHTIRVWETATRREIMRFSGNPLGARLLAISPDGRILAHGVDNTDKKGKGAERMIVLRNLATARSVAIPGSALIYGVDRHDLMPFLQPIGGHRGDIVCLVFSPDGMAALA